MNWITNFVRPKIQALIQKKQTEESLWEKCNGCGHLLFHKDLKDNLYVCKHCDYHFKISLKDRLDIILDEYSYHDLPKVPIDPLKFRDLKKYSDRLKEYKTKTTKEEASCILFGYISSIAVTVWAMDFSFMGGSMGVFVGQSFLNAVQLSIQTKTPFLAITASGGARMQEGILSLMQMPRTIIGVQQLREAKIPYITLLTDPTTGGVSASFAMMGDISIAEKRATIGFAGAKVIEETIRQKLPEEFQKSEYLLDHGMLDIVSHRHDLKKTIYTLLSHLKN